MVYQSRTDGQYNKEIKNMKVETRSQTELIYVDSGNKYKITFTDHPSNPLYLIINKGQTDELTIPKELIRNFCEVLAKFEL